METSMQTNAKINSVDSKKTTRNATTGRFRIVKLEERIAPSSATLMSLHRATCNATVQNCL